jgi:galactose mutarotase-like enzyme
MPYRQTTVTGFPAIALRNAEVEVVLVPALGNRVTHLRRLARGREWLWKNDQIPFALPRAGRSYVETADSGGWDECFPTVAPSPLPGAEPPVMLPDHGELWSAEWEGGVFEDAGGVGYAATARGVRLPYELSREITLDRGEPVVRFRYRLRHTGDAPFPWLWSSHPLLLVQPGTVVELPTVHQVRVDHVHGREDLAPGDMVSWPGAVGGSAARFVVPEPGAGWALKCFGDVGASGRMVVTDPRLGERLELEVDPAEVPQVGLWLNFGGWAPEGRRPYFNLGVEPCIGAPDALAAAVEEWGAAPVLRPGETRSWSVAVRLPEAATP